MKWIEQFDERQQKEIEFSTLYLNQFGHGTDGHNAKVIIAKMAQLLNKIEEQIYLMGGSEGKHSQGIVSYIENILGMK